MSYASRFTYRKKTFLKHFFVGKSSNQNLAVTFVKKIKTINEIILTDETPLRKIEHLQSYMLSVWILFR